MTIFVDMDGVVADFDGHYERHFGVRPTRWPEPDNVNWNRIKETPDFYRTIPLLPGAQDLVRYVDEVGEGCSFLTGVPISVNAAPNQKIEWANMHFPGFPIICCPAKDKWMHGTHRDILIDDYLRYRIDWINMGGVFVHHTDVPSTIAKLRELGKCALLSEES